MGGGVGEALLGFMAWNLFHFPLHPLGSGVQLILGLGPLLSGDEQVTKLGQSNSLEF